MPILPNPCYWDIFIFCHRLRLLNEVLICFYNFTENKMQTKNIPEIIFILKKLTYFV
jgi:hypothetical protein